MASTPWEALVPAPGRPQTAGEHLGALLGGEGPQQIEMMDHHVVEVGVWHVLAPPIRRRAGDGLAEFVADRHDPPNLPISHRVAKRLVLRTPTVVLIHHDNRTPGVTRRPDDRGCLGHIHGQRFLCQDVQVPLER